jgi:hypothetical protein
LIMPQNFSFTTSPKVVVVQVGAEEKTSLLHFVR